jgi:nucleotide-binding universal stress UspA family protein
MYRRILVPLDGSEMSEAALRVAGDLAEGTATEVILLTVAEPQHAVIAWAMESQQPLQAMGMVVPAAVETLTPRRTIQTKGQAFDRVRNELDAYLADRAKRLLPAGVEVERRVRFGDPIREIVDCAQEEGVDVIAMSTHGRTGPSRVLFGSVAGGVLRRGVKPVLMVRPEFLKS